ncbi:MAG: hypothetical protein HKN23_08755 [Verrucomicrobiales bacterium]|nr:hypothetical protein [Verrucomicrobiales bacterium]
MSNVFSFIFRSRLILFAAGILVAALFSDRFQTGREQSVPEQASSSLPPASVTPVQSGSAFLNAGEPGPAPISAVDEDGKLSLALINRLEELPAERVKISEGVGLVDDEEAVLEADQLLDLKCRHWHPLLCSLVALKEKSSPVEAASQVEEMLSASEKLGQAVVVSEGLDVENPVYPAMEARLHATEALLARYVYEVMISRRTEKWWAEWRDAWNRGVKRVPRDLVGQWTVVEGAGIRFAHATLEDHRCTLIWQEIAGGKVQKIDFEVQRVDEGKLASGAGDQELEYRLDFHSEFDPVLSFTVPAREANRTVEVKLQPDW